jgi:hypothetical protein
MSERERIIGTKERIISVGIFNKEIQLKNVLYE